MTVNTASLVNLIAKGTELAQRSAKPLVLFNGAKIYTSQASAMPLYIAGLIAEIGLIALTTYFLLKDARKDYRAGEEAVGHKKPDIVRLDPAEVNPNEFKARRKELKGMLKK